tara:strand:- start:18188 stop:19258 length:1071 start_codon:yes stop_codon:yes gene_type:complete
MKQMIKKILSREMINALQVKRQNVDLKVTAIARRSRWLASLYYFFFSAQFRREMHAVLNGRFRYHEAQRVLKPSSFMLRRNTHRLEKGLCMQPKRDIFAQGYIYDTVFSFDTCVSANILTSEEYAWSHDVLAEYFSVVTNTEVVNRAKDLFDKVLERATYATATGMKKPFRQKELEPTKISFNALKSLCENRHSVRWFKPIPVPRSLIDEAINVASTAPSACNRQPFEFFVFDTPEKAQKIGSIPMGTAGFSQNFQCVIVVVGDLSAYPYEKDRHIIYIDSALATMQMLLAFETRGLGSCVINWPDIERHEIQMADELQLQSYQRPMMLISIGYPDEDGMIPFSAKKGASDIARRL